MRTIKFTFLFALALILIGNLGKQEPVMAQSDSISTISPVKGGIGVLTFQKVVTDIDGSKYLIGEVSNNSPANETIEATVYFNKNSDMATSYYAKYIGAINPGMGIPFKIGLKRTANNGLTPDPTDLKIYSQVDQLPKPRQDDSLLAVDYSTLVIENVSHSVTGMIDNKSPNDVYGVRVSAIAIDNQAKVLDVVESDIIARIPANTSASFSLTPTKSVASQVGYYSCYVPTQSGLNYTLPVENNQTLQLEIWTDGKLKNVRYNMSSHSIQFETQGVLPGGGWVATMLINGPDSLLKSNYTAMLNGHNATKSTVSSSELSPGKFYKHINVLYPFGKNQISLVATTTVPEFQGTLAITGASLASVIVVASIFIRKTQIRK